MFDEALKQKYREDIIKMMQISDKDFIPPLSQRSSTTQSDLSANPEVSDGIEKYYNQMAEQEILGAFEDGVLLGFVSFRENYTSDVILESDLPNIYISTLILSPEARGRGLTYLMYDKLFNSLYSDRNVFTRTWSTNAAHIRILSKFNFELIKTIENDRGNGIDTVYFSKRKNNA